jgi:hypothetical protein
VLRIASWLCVRRCKGNAQCGCVLVRGVQMCCRMVLPRGSRTSLEGSPVSQLGAMHAGAAAE